MEPRSKAHISWLNSAPGLAGKTADYIDGLSAADADFPLCAVCLELGMDNTVSSMCAASRYNQREGRGQVWNGRTIVMRECNSMSWRTICGRMEKALRVAL